MAIKYNIFVRITITITMNGNSETISDPETNFPTSYVIILAAISEQISILSVSFIFHLISQFRLNLKTTLL